MHYLFSNDLQDGHLLEHLIDQEFARHGIILTPTEGKCDYDRILPDGKKLEVKFDLLSGFTGNVVAEDNLFRRDWDYIWHTTLMHKIYSRAEYQRLFAETYGRKRMPVGDQPDNWATLITQSATKGTGMYHGQFMKQYIHQPNQLT